MSDDGRGAQPPDDLPELRGYEFLDLLGHGSGGSVYLARQLTLDRVVAIKHLRISTPTRGNQALVKRFLREARTMAHLEHPNIVGVVDFFSEDPDFYLVLEYIDGPTLRQAQDRLTIPTELRLISELAAALDYAHNRGVAHRDVKPENVLLAPSGLSKLTDFGIAKIFSSTAYGSRFSSIGTRAGNVLGTAAYLSPEATGTTGEVDHRSDLYALGVVSYELLVGRLPFPVKSDFYATLLAHASDPVPRPTELIDGFPPQVEAVLLRALEKDPERRQHDVGAFWVGLEAAASEAWPGWQRHVNLAETKVQARRPPRDNRTVIAPAAGAAVRPPGRAPGPAPDSRSTIRVDPGGGRPDDP